MIIQTAPAGEPRLAIMMYEHTALSHQFARAFGNADFEPADPADLMFHVTLHHDAGWLPSTATPRPTRARTFRTIWSTRRRSTSPSPAAARPITTSSSTPIAG